jgi:hypothetical protein
MVLGDRMQGCRKPHHGLGLACGLFLLACAIACESPSTHVLLGQPYEANRDCVDPTTSIDIVDGPDPGFGCSPTCVVTPIGQNGSEGGVYVTTMCGPYPPLDDTTGMPAGCAGALAAFGRADTCSSDGTSTSPADAGPSDDSSMPPTDAVAADAGDGGD